MAWTKNVQDADAYFSPKNHVKAENWKAFSSDEKQAGFNQAKRELELSLGRDLQDPSTSTTRIRDDYALYEQALFILENSKRVSGKGASAVVDLDKKKEGTREDKRGPLIAPEASRYLGINRLKIVRG